MKKLPGYSPWPLAGVVFLWLCATICLVSCVGGMGMAVEGRDRESSGILAIVGFSQDCDLSGISTVCHTGKISQVEVEHIRRRVAFLHKWWVGEHPECAWCGTTKNVQCHDVLPIHWFPELADNTNNFLSLCVGCHCVLGHGRNFRTRYVPNVREVCALRIIIEEK